MALAPPIAAVGASSASGLRIVSVAGVDTNGNGRYEQLQVNSTMNVTSAGNFAIELEVLTGPPPDGRILVSSGTTVNLGVGTQAVSMTALGAALYLSNVDGPYTVTLTPMAVDDRGVEQYLDPSVSAETTTPPWTHTQFDDPWAAFGSPITDSGLDTDGNGLYDALVVHVPLVLSYPGPVQLWGALSAPGSNGTPIEARDSEVRFLGPGTFTWDLAFDGASVRTMQLPGPYLVNITLDLPNLPYAAYFRVPVISTRYTTGAYTPDQFDFPSIAFDARSVNGTGLDTNGDGLADFYEFPVPVTVHAAGNYALRLALAVSEKSIVAERLLWLSPGSQTVDLLTSGIAVGRQGNPSLFTILSASPLDPSAQPGDYTTWMTPVPSIAFDARYPENLTIQVSGSTGSCEWFQVVDPITRFATDSTVYSPHHTYSTNVLSLYNGTFDVYIGSCYGPLAMTQRITVSGPTTVTVTLPPPRPYAVQADVTPAAWNATRLTMSADWGSQSPILRRIADEAGNWDGFANASELRLAAGGYGVVHPWLGPGVVEPGDVQVFMGGIPLPVTASSLGDVSGADDVLSSNPVRVSGTYTLRTMNDPGPEPHILRVRVPYADAYTSLDVHLNLSSFAGANLNAVTRMYASAPEPNPGGSAGFIWDGNATIQSAGTDLWNVSAGWAPTGFLDPVSLELQIGFGALPTAHQGSVGQGSGNLDLTWLIPIIPAAVGVAAAVVLIRRRRGEKEPPPE